MKAKGYIPEEIQARSNYNTNKWKKAHGIAHIFFRPICFRHWDLRVHRKCNFKTVR
ncbi:hypothetical protein bsdtb5_42570 [Anaeromicropila herbilytica]|uniref:Uncharacterized protein n=1 Tax=Anaeromicropila herbilytica TaxID=2785025 RepID=A0A7R7IET6_9FIRM|nr:hypothetical protein bsdtb5_42570 [Anaeromicropila herbilytica]